MLELADIVVDHELAITSLEVLQLLHHLGMLDCTDNQVAEVLSSAREDVVSKLQSLVWRTILLSFSEYWS